MMCGDARFAIPITLQAGSGDDSLVRPFDAVAYSGGKLYVKGFPHPVVVDLMAMVVKGAEDGTVPVTLDHKSEKRVGGATVKNNRREILMAGTTSASSEARDEVVNSARDGFRWQASIEGRVAGGQVVKAGHTVMVNGRAHTGPLIVARPFVLRAVSFVSSGGDDDNAVRLAAAEGGQSMFEKWLETKGFVKDELSDDQLATLRAAWEAETAGDDNDQVDGDQDQTPPDLAASATTRPAASPAPAPAGGDLAAAAQQQVRQAAQDEMQRLRMVQQHLGDHADLAAKAIEEGWDQTKCELEALRAERADVPAAHVTDRVPEGTSYSRVVEAALCMQVPGMKDEDLVRWYGEPTLQAARHPSMRSYGLVRLMHDTIRSRGWHVRNTGIPDTDTIRMCLRADADLQGQAMEQGVNLYATEGWSTLTTTGVLANIANKSLLSAYRAYPMIASRVCGTRSAADFKVATMYRMTMAGKLEKLGPNGEIEHTDLIETPFTAQVETFARMLSISRHHMVNDDLGAFANAARQFGRVSARTVDYWFHYKLLDNNGGTFFTAPKGNFLSGANTVLQIASLTLAEQAFLNLEDDAGFPIGLGPDGLLVSPGNNVKAGQLYNDVKVVGQGKDADPVEDGNPHAGKFMPLTSPWLNKAMFTNASDLGWYLYADPNELPFMILSYLRGTNAPIVETSETDFNTLGVQWRAYLDFGVDWHDDKAAIFVKGEA